MVVRYSCRFAFSALKVICQVAAQPLREWRSDCRAAVSVMGSFISTDCLTKHLTDPPRPVVRTERFLRGLPKIPLFRRR